MIMVTGYTGGAGGDEFTPKKSLKSRYKMTDGKPFDDPTIHTHSLNDSPKRVFKIEVGNVPEEEIEEYIRNIANKFKMPPPDYAEKILSLKGGNKTDGDYPLSIKGENKMDTETNYFAASARTTTNNFMHIEPNSHFWNDLNHFMNYLNSIESCGNQYYLNAFGAEIEYLIIGLKNTKKRRYKIRKLSKPKLDYDQFLNEAYPIFSDIENIITHLKTMGREPSDFYTFKKCIENTINAGFNLTNGRKLERTDVYKRLDGERDYQDKKWGTRRTADGTPDEKKPVAEWINYMEFHIAKAKEKVYYLDTQAALAEIRKVTALGVRAMEIHGCPPRGGTPVIGDEKPSCDCDCKK